MTNPVRNFLHQYVPTQFHDPIGLFVRLMRTGNAAAYFAMWTAGLGVILTPLDMFLQIFEKRLYANAPKPQKPLILVCGAPRTGTTLATQVLINNLPVGFLNNLTSIFPRSPIMANKLFGRFLRPKTLAYESYYGKSMYFSGPNDALYIWDRWFGDNRTIIPTSLSVTNQEAMKQFFGAYEQYFQKSVISKNNNLNTYANIVADVFENAHFICMTRDPLFLAQSLLKARLDIHGDVNVAYGLDKPDSVQTSGYIEDVCDQVLFHEQAIAAQQELIGTDRFWIIQYEKFCQHPEELVKRVYDEILKQDAPMADIQANLKPFEVSNKVKLDPALFEEVEQTYTRLKNVWQNESV